MRERLRLRLVDLSRDDLPHALPAEAGFTLKVYARDARDEAAVVEDLLVRAAQGGIGG